MSDEFSNQYYVWSNEHNAWWKPGLRGYSPGLKEAGKYTREQALRICRDAIPSAAYVGRLSEIPVRVDDINEFLKGGFIPACVFTGDRELRGDDDGDD